MKTIKTCKAVILLVATMLFVQTVYAQNKVVRTSKYNDIALIHFGGYDSEVTVHYYMDDNNNRILHGNALTVVDQNGVRYRNSTNFIDDELTGPITASIDFNKKGIHAKGKMNGEMKQRKMVGSWTISYEVDGTVSSLAFRIKDRDIVNYKESFKDNSGGLSELSVSVDSEGNSSGYEKLPSGTVINIKKGIYVDRMKDRDGNWCKLTPDAKSILDKFLKGEAEERDFVEIGLCLEKSEKNFCSIIDESLNLFDFGIDSDIEYYYLQYVRQIPNNQLLDFNECKRILDNKQNSLSDLLSTANDMLEDNTYNRKYINKATAQSLEEYINTTKEQWLATKKKNINGLNDVVSFVSYWDTLGNDLEALTDDERKEMGDVANAKYSDLVTEMMTNIEEEIDYVALVNYYESTVMPSKQYLPNETISTIDSSYQKKKGELENTVSAKIVDEMSRKESSKDLKEYYNSIQNVVASLPSSSSTIRSTYDNKYAELVKKEEKAERKAARRSKVIKTLEWVGVGVAVVGGYLIYKYVLPEKQ